MVEFTTPVGRIVWGHPCRSKDKTNDDNQKVMKADGSGVVQQWSFGLAIPKADFQQHVWPYLFQEASTGYPNGAPGNFAWKYVDGDGVDNKGNPFSQREGYAGHYVLAISTELMAPPIFKFNGTGFTQQPAEALKCGDYVAVGINAKLNVPRDAKKKPSLYINPVAVEVIGYGTEIVSTGSVDPAAMFGGVSRQLPPGASATPIGGSGGGVGMPGMGQQPQMMPPAGGMSGMPGQPQPMMAPPAAQPAMGQQPQMMPPAGSMPGAAMGQPVMPAPAPDFLQQPQMMPPAGGMPGMPGQPQPGMMMPGMMPQR